MDRSRGASSTAIAISGEPGIGKTRLLAELVAVGENAGQLALSGRAAQFERDVPFAVFIDALDGYLASQTARRFESLGPNHLTELARIFPALAPPAEGEGPAGQSERYRAHYAVAALLELLAAKRPLVLALDDLQWADEGSLELVAHLLRRPRSGTQVLAISYRPGEAPRRLADAIDAATRQQLVELIELSPLSEADAAALVSDEPNTETFAWLYRESGGNPFYLEQLRRSVRGTPRLPASEGRTGADDVPPAVAAGLAGELAALAAATKRLLEGASVAGDPFRLELAAAAAELSEAEGRDALDELLRRELIQPTEVPRRFRFRHPIVHRTVYAGARRGWRIGAHGRLRDALERQGASPTDLAHHVEQAAIPGDERAIATLESAAHAAAQLAPGPAADWFAAALRLLPEDDLGGRLEILVPMATALAASGRLEESRAPLMDAIDLMPGEAEGERVGLIAFLSAIDHLLGHHNEASTLVRSALDDLPDPSTPGAVALQIELANDANYASDFEEARRWGHRALASAEKGDQRAYEAGAAAALGLACLFPGHISESERHCTRAEELIDALDDHELATYTAAAFWLVHLQFFLERYVETVNLSRRVLAISRSTGQGQFLINMKLVGAWALISLGRAAEARELIDESIEAARLAGNAQGLAWALWVRCWIAAATGDFSSALSAGEESISVGAELDQSILPIAGYAHIGYVCAEAGEHERCRELMDQAGAPDFARFYADRRPHWWEALSRVALEQGREDEAEAWLERGEEFVDDLGLPVATAAIRRARARLLLARNEPELAADLALEAARAEEGRGARIAAARSRIIAGRALVAFDRGESAIEQLERAYAELDACGAMRYRDEAARELRRLGRTVPHVAPRASAREGVEALSGREREIAAMAAEAKTNREIAGALYISEKTVEKHLSKVFAKLGISGRAAIGARLAAVDSERY